MSNFCLDNVYMNYLQEKTKSSKPAEETKTRKSRKGRRKSLKPQNSSSKKVSTEKTNTLRRNSSSKVVVRHTSSNQDLSKDDSDLGSAPPKGFNPRARRASLQPGNLLPVPPSSSLVKFGGIREDEASDDNDSSRSVTPNPGSRRSSLTPSPAPTPRTSSVAPSPAPRSRRGSLTTNPAQSSRKNSLTQSSDTKVDLKKVEDDISAKDEANDNVEESNSLTNDDKLKETENKTKETQDDDVQDEDLLLKLMKKNVKESEFTPEQKALYDAHDTLLDEFKRRKAQRQKIGALIRKKAWSLRGLLGEAKCKSGESDLTLKARSMDLQKHKKQAKKESRRLSSYGQVADRNRI